MVRCAVNPNAKSVTSESLSALWVLEWTTEQEILFLMEKGLPWKPSGPVQQEIDVDAKTLSNRMIFGDDSLFEVFSSIDPEVRSVWFGFVCPCVICVAALPLFSSVCFARVHDELLVDHVHAATPLYR